MILVYMFLAWWCIGILSFAFAVTYNWMQGANIYTGDLVGGMLFSLLGPVYAFIVVKDLASSFKRNRDIVIKGRRKVK
jgi:hypothetical protein